MAHPLPLFQTKSGLSLFFNESSNPAGEDCRYSIDIKRNGQNVTGMWLTANSPILNHLKILAQSVKSGKSPELITKELIQLNQLLVKNGGYSSLQIAQVFAEIYADNAEAAKKALETLEEVKKDWGNRKDALGTEVSPELYDQISQFIETMMVALKQILLGENQAEKVKENDLHLVLRIKA